MLNSLPALRNQQAVVVGEGVVLPMRIRFDDLPEAKRPHSDSASFAREWQEERGLDGFVARTIERWRKQIRQKVLVAPTRAAGVAQLCRHLRSEAGGVGKEGVHHVRSGWFPDT